jgi:hypothetical protein
MISSLYIIEFDGKWLIEFCCIGGVVMVIFWLRCIESLGDRRTWLEGFVYIGLATCIGAVDINEMRRNLKTIQSSSLTFLLNPNLHVKTSKLQLRISLQSATDSKCELFGGGSQ